MKPKKYKFNVLVGKVEEPYTGIFEDANGVDAYTRAINWYAKFGKSLIKEGKNLVFRECLVNGESNVECLPPLKG